jgi:hypothetical protein
VDSDRRKAHKFSIGPKDDAKATCSGRSSLRTLSTVRCLNSIECSICHTVQRRSVEITKVVVHAMIQEINVVYTSLVKLATEASSESEILIRVYLQCCKSRGLRLILHLSSSHLISSILHSVQMENAPSTRIQLSDMPLVVLRNIISYLDLGHVISLAEVRNHRLREILTVEFNGLWAKLIRSRLHTTIPRGHEKHAFAEALRHARTERCAHCGCMEFERRAYFSPFWRLPLCDRCRFRNPYRLVTAYTATHNYCLDRNDLLDLRTISDENPHYRTGSYTRRFSRVDVMHAHRRKLRKRHMTELEWLALRAVRSLRAKRRHRKSVIRRRQYIMAVSLGWVSLMQTITTVTP